PKAPPESPQKLPIVAPKRWRIAPGSLPNRVLFEAFWAPKGKAARRSAWVDVAKCCICCMRWGVGFRVRGSGFGENREWARVPASPRRAFRTAGKLLAG